MNTTIANAAPRPILLGARDGSSTASQAAPTTQPQFVPHIFFFAPKGSVAPQVVDSGAFTTIYGADALDETSDYYFHSNALAKKVLAAGGTIVASRLFPEDAEPAATIQVCLDLLTTTVQLYTTNSSGVSTPDGAPVPGYIGKFVIRQAANGILGQATQGQGTQTDGTGAQSHLYPLFEIQATSVGNDGNNQGFAISAPTTKSINQADTTAINAINAFIFNFRQISRTAANVTGTTQPTISGDATVPFTLAPNSFYKATNTQYAMAKSVLAPYQSLNKPGIPPVYGNFGALYIYQEFIDTILAEIFTAELNAGGGVTGAAATDKYMVNLFGATDVDGNPYKTFSLLGAGGGGTIFTDNTTVYAAGGSDGTMSLDTLDTLTRDQLEGYATSIYNYSDMAIWPQSWWIDSGYSIDTKEAAGPLLTFRQDFGVAVSTQDVSLPQNSASADSSTAVALSTSLSSYAESSYYGTKVCRAVVIGQSGYLVSDPTGQQLLPLSIDVANKMATYMGASDGNWKAGYAFDKTPLNKITEFYGINATSKSQTAYTSDWTNNLVWAQNYDRVSQFYPAFQTVYDDDTSVLNSLFTVAAVIELEKVCFRVWRDLTGREDLTQAQLIKESNKLLAAQVPSAKFDGRYKFAFNTYFTVADNARGYSWTTDVTIYANSMYTVGTFTIDSRNMSELSTSAS